MVLIINHDKNLNLFNNEQFVILNDVCEIKHLKDEEYTILLLNIDINNDGIIRELNCFFEEIIISLKILAIISNCSNDKLREICNFHKISLLEIQ